MHRMQALLQDLPKLLSSKFLKGKIMGRAALNLTGILNRLNEGSPLEKNDVKYILGLSDPENIQRLFAAARNVRARFFKNKIFLYGFLYFSTYCRNDCRFCRYRRSNHRLSRYRKTKSEILDVAAKMSDAGVHLIDLTMGEDPEFFSELISMVKSVQKRTGLPIMISPGVVPDNILVDLAGTGVCWFACYQETHNKDLYSYLRKDQRFETRLEKKQFAKDLGMLIEEGILTGVGESPDDLADSIIQMKESGADQVRVMTFVPQEDTPMGKIIARDSLTELLIIAVMRLVMPDRLIPASLDVGGLAGLKDRLNAGANVVTSIVPPEKGLAGVANHSLDIEDSKRTLDHILPVLKTCGLTPALPEEYLAWVTDRQKDRQKEKIIC